MNINYEIILAEHRLFIILYVNEYSPIISEQVLRFYLFFLSFERYFLPGGDRVIIVVIRKFKVSLSVFLNNCVGYKTPKI